MKPWLNNLGEGKSQPPVKERTKAMRTAATRYWRAKGLIFVKEDRKGKKALPPLFLNYYYDSKLTLG